jgi:hypothetical protein
MGTSKPKPPHSFTISDCRITMEAQKTDANTTEAVRQLAIACAENARALTKAAESLAGAPDNRVGIQLSGPSV